MKKEYDLYSKFDIDKHAKTYINYLEVVIDSKGEVNYAIPSHQEYLVNKACRDLHLTKQEVINMCPKERYFDYDIWLCEITHCMLVWNDFVRYSDNLTVAQIVKLRELKMKGLYRGKIPQILQTKNRKS